LSIVGQGLIFGVEKEIVLSGLSKPRTFEKLGELVLLIKFQAVRMVAERGTPPPFDIIYAHA